jgi:hypothetical protein
MAKARVIIASKGPTMTRQMSVLLVALTGAVLMTACSFPSEPSPVGGATVASQAIVTNAPGGIPVPAQLAQGASCPSVVPSVRLESDWPKATHVSADWGHSDVAVQVEIVLDRRDDHGPAVVLKPNEHTDGAGAVSHHTERVLPLGIYDGSVTYVYPNCRSRSFVFNGLNHGVASLPGINLSTPGLGNQPPA